MATKKIKGNFAVNSEVIVKSGGLPAIIREAQGPKTWKLEFVNVDNGAPNGVFRERVKSQMLRRPRNGEFPGSNSTAKEKMEEEESKAEEVNEPPPDLQLDPTPAPTENGSVELALIDSNSLSEIIDGTHESSSHASSRGSLHLSMQSTSSSSKGDGGDDEGGDPDNNQDEDRHQYYDDDLDELVD